MPPDLSRVYVEEELAALIPLKATFGWELRSDFAALKVRTTLKSARDNQIYVLDLAFDNYKEWPPYLEFVEWDTGKIGTRRAYPKGGRGYFHTHPCICAPFSRKAYNRYGGPHGDWDINNWISLTPTVNTLGDILLLVQRLLNDSTYQGRMEP